MPPQGSVSKFSRLVTKRKSLAAEARRRVRGFVAVLLFLIAWWVGAVSIIEGFELEAPLLILVHLCVCGAAPFWT